MERKARAEMSGLVISNLIEQDSLARVGKGQMKEVLKEMSELQQDTLDAPTHRLLLARIDAPSYIEPVGASHPI